MRISGGQLKGRRVAGGKKVFSSGAGKGGLRPTSAKVREAVFDILQAEIRGAVFLDLYAGTGAVGLEALSRGAEKVFFVEDNMVRSKSIEDYIKKTGFDKMARVYRKSADQFLKGASESAICFDIIFADPPYASDEIKNVFLLLDGNDVLKEGGCLMVEHCTGLRLMEEMQTLGFIKNYRYGDTMLTLYRKGR